MSFSFGRMFSIVLVITGTNSCLFSQTFTTLASFDGLTTGCGPQWMSWIQGPDGNFYGTTGSDNGPTTVDKLTPSGQLTALYTFPNGWNPYNSLLLGIDGNLYGTTTGGGAYNDGAVFRLSLKGTFTVLHSFDLTDGLLPYDSLIQASDDNLYGTTFGGGSEEYCQNGCGTIFKISPSGNFKSLYQFVYSNVFADHPYGGLAEGIDGNFYGSTYNGGHGICYGGCGITYRITPKGSLTILDYLNAQLYASFLLAPDNNLYATDVNGDLFSMTRRGNITNLATIAGGVYAPPVLATDSNFYLTSEFYGFGEITQVTPTGVSNVLYNFCSEQNCLDGAGPSDGLVEATSGVLYGSTSGGGANGCGTAYSLDVSLPPYVKLVHDAGKAGQTGGILGQGFTGTTSVSLNGTPMSFVVVSDTFIKATVPAGATTGYVSVATPTGTLTTNLPFHVIP